MPTGHHGGPRQYRTIGICGVQGSLHIGLLQMEGPLESTELLSMLLLPLAFLAPAPLMSEIPVRVTSTLAQLRPKTGLPGE